MPESKTPRAACILLVDDNDCLRTGLKQLLTLKGYRIIEALDPETALNLLKQFGNDVQVLVTDIVMPGMNGFELSRRVRRLYPGIGVIYISAYGSAEMTDPQFHDDVVLRKPFATSVLIETIERVLRRHPGIQVLDEDKPVVPLQPRE